MKRFSLSIPCEMQSKLEILKKEKFYNNTKAEMFRYLIKCSLDSSKTETKKA